MFTVTPVAGTDDYKIRMLRTREVPKFEPLVPRDGLLLARGPDTRAMFHFLRTFTENSS